MIHPIYQDLSHPEGDSRSLKEKLKIQLWYIVRSTLFKSSPEFMYNWRKRLLTWFGAKIGEGVRIRPSADITYPWNIEIGDYSYIGDGATLYSLTNIVIGKNCSISAQAYICTGTHDHKAVSFTLIVKSITIEDEVWLANGSFLMPGVSIGRGSICAARSVITKSIPSNSIVSGQPGRVIGQRISQVRQS
jgi:putative colanic acid biosynthesis acetyltransferase WcaF